jgi:hypothetical protein
VEQGVDIQRPDAVDVTDSGISSGNSATPSCNVVNSETRVDEAVLLGGQTIFEPLPSHSSDDEIFFQASRASFTEKHMTAGAVFTVSNGDSGGVPVRLPKSINVLWTGISSLRGGQAISSSS